MKILRVLWLFLKSSLSLDMEYRANFIAAFVMGFFEMAWSITSVLLLYNFAEDLGGWRYHEALIVLGLVHMAWGLNDCLLWPNIQQLAEHIRKGTLDFMFTKPLNSQLHTTLRRYKFDRIMTLLCGLLIIAYALWKLQYAPTLGQWLALLGLFSAAMVMMYALIAMLATLSFWVMNVEHLTELFFGLLETGRYPVRAFPEPLRMFISFIIPIAFISTVPAEALLGRINPSMALYGLGFSAVALMASIWFWNYGSLHYASAN